MPPTTSYKRGDVVLIPFPFTDLSGSKQRPALIVSPDSANASRDDIVVVAITSHVPEHLAPDEIMLSLPDATASGLLKASMVKVSKLVTIHRDLVRKKIGTLPPPKLRMVLDKLQEMFGE